MQCTGISQMLHDFFSNTYIGQKEILPRKPSQFQLGPVKKPSSNKTDTLGHYPQGQLSSSSQRHSKLPGETTEQLLHEIRQQTKQHQRYDEVNQQEKKFLQEHLNSEQHPRPLNQSETPHSQVSASFSDKQDKGSGLAQVDTVQTTRSTMSSSQHFEDKTKESNRTHGSVTIQSSLETQQLTTSFKVSQTALPLYETTRHSSENISKKDTTTAGETPYKRAHAESS